MDLVIPDRTLLGRYASLEPIKADAYDELRKALDTDADAWHLQYVSAQGEYFDAYWQTLLQQTTERSRVAYLVRSLATGAVVGTSSIYVLSPENRTAEIGSTFLRPEARGTLVNPEMKLLMLEQLFEADALRVQFTVDSRNARSQAAVSKLGATREGVMRRHLVTWTGHQRDSVLFSIVGSEWPSVRSKLSLRLQVVVDPPCPTLSRVPNG